jgi:hypothetical protein
MKKLIVIMLVAMVPFITMAQKRGKKDKNAKQEVKIPSVNFMVITGIAITPDMDMKDEISDGAEGVLMRQRIKEKGLKISFDFGSQVHKEMKELIAEARSLHSMTDAVNILTKWGWEFSGSDIQTDENVTFYYYYMQRK